MGLLMFPRPVTWRAESFSLAGLLAALAILAGCGGSSNFAVRTEVVPYTQDQVVAREQAHLAEYRLRPGDIIKLAFKYEDDLDQDTVLVLPDGYINVVGINGNFHVAGMTTTELEKILTDAYSRDYRNPDLSVIVVQIAPFEVYVLGQVKKPGLYPMPPMGLGALQAIAMAGGFEDAASKSEVTVLRAAEDGFLTRTFNLNHLEKGTEVYSELFSLQPYDIVYVPKSGLGDFAYFTDKVFGSTLHITRVFWDIYAMLNLDKIDRVAR